MSGPIISYEEQRRIERMMEEERKRREHHRQLVAKRSEYVQGGYSLCEKIKILQIRLQAIIDQGDTPVQKSANCLKQELRSCCDRWDSLVRSLQSNTSEGIQNEINGLLESLTALRSGTDNAEKRIDELESALREFQVEQLQKKFDEIDANYSQIQTQDEETNVRDDAKAKQLKSIAEFYQEIERIQSRLSELYKRAELARMRDEQLEAKCLLDELAGLMGSNNWSSLHTLDVCRVQVLIQRILMKESRNQELDLKLSKHLAVYDALCEETGLRPQNSFPFLEESVKEIDDLCSDLLEYREWILRRKYLFERIHTFLSQNGLEYIGEKEEGQDVVHRAYRIKNQIVLHILYTKAGRITLEVAMEDTQSRVPNKFETELITDAQLGNCALLEALFDEINADGIELTKLFDGKGQAGFARIIDTSGFINNQFPTNASRFEQYRSMELKYMMDEGV